jgi:hypothetical protein
MFPRKAVNLFTKRETYFLKKGSSVWSEYIVVKNIRLVV